MPMVPKVFSSLSIGTTNNVRMPPSSTPATASGSPSIYAWYACKSLTCTAWPVVITRLIALCGLGLGDSRRQYSSSGAGTPTWNIKLGKPSTTCVKVPNFASHIRVARHQFCTDRASVCRAKRKFGVQKQMFGSVTQVKRGVSQQIIGMNPQDRTFTRHLNSPRRETVDDPAPIIIN